MGNIGSHTGQISSTRANAGLRPEVSAKGAADQWVRSFPRPKTQLQHKVLPDPGSREKLRHTNNGEILQSGGTLSGRHQVPLQHAVSDSKEKLYSKSYLPTQRYSFHKTGLRVNPYQNKQNATSQKSLKAQVKAYRSEPDLRYSTSGNQEMKERKSKKKYKAPPPPSSRPQVKRPIDWEENSSDEFPLRRTRLFKTRAERQKETSHVNRSEQVTEAIENTSDIIEEKIFAQETPVRHLRTNRLSLPEINLADTNEFQKELREATNRLRAAKIQEIQRELHNENLKVAKEQKENKPRQQTQEIEENCPRGEPSGKESSTPEMSPVLGAPEIQKPRAFYFGMEREDSDVSSNSFAEDDDENVSIALRLRPVLPRKPPEVPRFSPAAAWRLLDARSHDSGISGDACPPPSMSWTPQQDLGDDSSLEEARQEAPRPTRPRPHVFSLSLPRDHQLAAFATMGSNRNDVSSLRRLKRSVSGVLSTLSSRRDPEKRASSREDDSNWFFSRSAPNSLNENSLDVPDASFPHTSSTSRLMYLPETSPREYPQDDKYLLSVFSKSCEELRVPESLRDSNNILTTPWSTEDRPKRPKKFTFQSTVRQIERRRMAEKLSKEAEKKEKQRLRELEAMRRVEEEFQKKRAKEKANIRHQLRLYAMDDSQWSSLPPDINMKTEERQEPDGALSSSTSSSSLPPSKTQELDKKNDPAESKCKITTHVTQELSEYRQIQRDYKDYRGNMKYSADNRHSKQTTVHPGVTCNMPKAKGSNPGNGNYRKDFVYGIKSTKSICSNHSEESQNNSPKMYNKYAPITRF